jgi:hypothetical protein
LPHRLGCQTPAIRYFCLLNIGANVES